MIAALPEGPFLNLSSKNEHVPEIKRCIRVVKEQARATRHRMPFSNIPKLLMIYIVFATVKMLNYFPTKGGVSANLSPCTIMTGEIGAPPLGERL